MRKLNAENERIKRDYLAYLTEAKRQSEKTVDQVAAAIAAFEASTGRKDFKRFHIEQAKAFKRHLSSQVNAETGKPLAVATIHSRLMALKAFFQWLAGRPGFRKIGYSDADYFNPSANDGRIASASREKPAPSVEQVRHVLATMPHGTDIEKRNRALIAFVLLTGARDDAIASMSVRHVDLVGRVVMQDARTVRTKRRKTFSTYFFPVGDGVESIVAEWIAHLGRSCCSGRTIRCSRRRVSPASREPASRLSALSGRTGPTRRPSGRSSGRPSRRRACPTSYPHSFRTTLVRLGETTMPQRGRLQGLEPEPWA
jgi:site-specific recombinase XerD